MEGWQGQREEAARERGEEDGKRREARYLLPCLSESKRCQKVENGGGRNTERQKEGKKGRKQELVNVIKEQERRVVKWLENSLPRGPAERMMFKRLKFPYVYANDTI